MRGKFVNIKEVDVSKTKYGREGTVVHVFGIKGLPRACEIEFDNGELETIEENRVSEVIWRFLPNKD